jgi:hypothetical protein
MPRSLAVARKASEPDEWLTPKEAAELARLSTSTLANHRYQGIGIPFTKLTPGRGGRIRYRRSHVLQWLAGEIAA